MRDELKLILERRIAEHPEFRSNADYARLSVALGMLEQYVTFLAVPVSEGFGSDRIKGIMTLNIFDDFRPLFTLVSKQTSVCNSLEFHTLWRIFEQLFALLEGNEDRELDRLCALAMWTLIALRSTHDWHHTGSRTERCKLVINSDATGEKFAASLKSRYRELWKVDLPEGEISSVIEFLRIELTSLSSDSSR
jgi:hypothetical protein